MSEVSKADRVIPPEKPTSLLDYANSKLNDLDVTVTFYDQLLAGFDVGRLVAQANKAAYHRIRKVHFDVIVPFTGRMATVAPAECDYLKLCPVRRFGRSMRPHSN